MFLQVNFHSSRKWNILHEDSSVTIWISDDGYKVFLYPDNLARLEFQGNDLTSIEPSKYSFSRFPGTVGMGIEEVLSRIEQEFDWF